jgi:hypothetical protein
MSNVVPPLHRSENEALWSYVSRMAEELKAMKAELNKTTTVSTTQNKYHSEAYFTFVTKLRGKMRANVEKNYYPSIKIDGMELGIDFNGLMYDRKTSRTLPRALAFEVYHKLYDHHLVKPLFE